MIIIFDITIIIIIIIIVIAHISLPWLGFERRLLKCEPGSLQTETLMS